MLIRVHALAGTLATLCILGFWSSTVVAELFLDADAVFAVKRAILFSMGLLIPSMIATGASGFTLARGRAGVLVTAKKRRMPFIAANGLLLLLPAAVYLYRKAAAGEFDGAFYAFQAVELLAGAINLTLLTRNFRDGLRLAGRFSFPPRVQ